MHVGQRKHKSYQENKSRRLHIYRLGTLLRQQELEAIMSILLVLLKEIWRVNNLYNQIQNCNKPPFSSYLLPPGTPCFIRLVKEDLQLQLSKTVLAAFKLQHKIIWPTCISNCEVMGVPFVAGTIRCVLFCWLLPFLFIRDGNSTHILHSSRSTDIHV